MKIELAVEYEGHAPDSTIEVEDWVGAALVSQGRARVAAVPGPKSKAARNAEKLAADIESYVVESAATATVVTGGESA